MFSRAVLAICSLALASQGASVSAQTDGGLLGPRIGLSTGEPVQPQPAQPATGTQSEVYVKAIVDDWEVRCVRTGQAQEPCEMYQLLFDASGTPTAEISIFRVSQDDIAAGARIVTPLETLLTRGLTMAVDDVVTKRYPFNYCVQIGCLAQVGFTPDEVTAMKQGEKAVLTIVPARAPNSTVELVSSLIGFTAAFDQLPQVQSPN